MSRLVLRRQLPLRLSLPDDRTRPHRFVLIYDRRFRRSPAVCQWLERFTLRCPVDAGEELKSVDLFPGHLRRVLRMVPDATRRNTTLVGLGGGSVGDFVGFTASVLKRGVGLIHIPTTWLSAMDSAHGGKTALNVEGVKNQIGSFYPADSVIAVRSLLSTLSQTDTMSGLGELIKIAIIDDGDLFDALKRSRRWDRSRLWSLLPQAIEAKMRIVDTDPLELTGRRQVLNLGHTLAHVLESHYHIAHGIAVALGLRFAVEWSAQLCALKRQQADSIIQLLDRVPQFDPVTVRRRGLTTRRLSALLVRDKKATDVGFLNFVFIERVGRVRVERVAIPSVVSEAKRQGWL